MRRHRTTARGTLLLLLCLGLLAGTASARPRLTPIVFPVVGPVSYSDDFGDRRAGGRHEGNDVLAPRKALAVAAENGTVTFWTRSASAGCMLYLHGDGGTTYEYIHLNNDLGAGNDNRGTCVAGTAYAPGLKDGDRVAAGEVVGFVGDSGDANGIHPHLHFEVHPHGGAAADPYPYLQAAQRLLFASAPDRLFALALTGTVVSMEEGTLTLKVSTLRVAPGGRRQTKVGRTLAVSVPADAALTGADAIDEVRPGQRATVWTSPSIVTLAAELGSDGALSAAKIALAD